MEMFLSALVISLLGVCIAAVLFRAAIREPPQPNPVETGVLRALPTRFFVSDQKPAPRVVPMEVLRLQIERHIRLEQAAAESFGQCPTPEALHAMTTSPLVH